MQDLWTQNYYYPFSKIRKKKEEKLEIKTLSLADALVTVSEPASRELGELHKNKVIYTVTNGFDPLEREHKTGLLTDKFTLTYTGNIYPGKQSPEPVFSALHESIRQGEMRAEDVEVRFYGAELNWINEMASHYELSTIVKQYGIVDREKAIKKQRESQILILLKWNDPEQKGVYTAKIFEYLAAKRPILAVGDYEDVVDNLLEDTKAGVSVKTKDNLKNELMNLYQEYKQKRIISYNANESVINKYNQKEMARKFAAILDNLG